MTIRWTRRAHHGELAAGVPKALEMAQANDHAHALP